MCTVFPSTHPYFGHNSRRSCNTPVVPHPFARRNIMRLACIPEARSLCKELFFTFAPLKCEWQLWQNVSQIPSIALRMHRTESRRCGPFEETRWSEHRSDTHPRARWPCNVDESYCFQFDNCFTSAWCAADGIYLIVRCYQVGAVVQYRQHGWNRQRVPARIANRQIGNMFQHLWRNAPTNEPVANVVIEEGRCWQFWQSWWRNFGNVGRYNSHQMWADMEQLQSSSFHRAPLFHSILATWWMHILAHCPHICHSPHPQAIWCSPSVCMLYDFFKSPVHRCNNTIWFPTIILQPSKW